MWCFLYLLFVLPSWWSVPSVLPLNPLIIPLLLYCVQCTSYLIFVNLMTICICSNKGVPVVLLSKCFIIYRLLFSMSKLFVLVLNFWWSNMSWTCQHSSCCICAEKWLHFYVCTVPLSKCPPQAKSWTKWPSFQQVCYTSHMKTTAV